MANTRLFPLVEGDFTTRRKARVSGLTIQMALLAIERFCSDNGATLDTATIVDITLAWHYGRFFEWTPLAKGFRRINFRAPSYDTDLVAIVEGYREFDRQRTDELNQSISRATGGKWAEVQK